MCVSKIIDCVFVFGRRRFNTWLEFIVFIHVELKTIQDIFIRINVTVHSIILPMTGHLVYCICIPLLKKTRMTIIVRRYPNHISSPYTY